MAAMTYELEEPVTVQNIGPSGERYEVKFTAGVHAPKNEDQEHALELLVEQGLAKRVKARKAEE